MTILSQLLPASFRGVPFLFNANNETGGRKSVVYEFPNRDKRTVTDLGKLLKVYKMKGIIKGQASTYIQNRNQLVKALEAPGSGQLVHPLDGTVTVFAKPYVLNESISSLGWGEFDLEFYATTEPIFPTQSDSQSSSVFNLINEINSAIQDAFEEAWNVAFLAQDAIDKVANAMNEVSRAFQTASALVSLSSNLITPIENSITELTNSAALLEPDTLSSNINDSFSNLFNGCQSSEDQATVMSSFSQFNGFNTGGETGGLVGPNINNTVSRNAANNNVIIINQITNIIAINYNFAATTTLDFNDENDILNKRNQLNEQYEFIINSNTFETIEGISLPIITNNTIELLQDSKVLTDSYLRDLDNTAHKITTITVGRESLLPLVYKLYGNLDNLVTIQELNAIGDPTNVTGTIKVISQ